jgi:hypothetical protein
MDAGRGGGPPPRPARIAARTLLYLVRAAAALDPLGQATRALRHKGQVGMPGIPCARAGKARISVERRVVMSGWRARISIMKSSGYQPVRHPPIVRSSQSRICRAWAGRQAANPLGRNYRGGRPKAKESRRTLVRRETNRGGWSLSGSGLLVENGHSLPRHRGPGRWFDKRRTNAIIRSASNYGRQEDGIG